MNSWDSFSKHETLNHELAIRRFCPARLEQEQGVSDQWSIDTVNDSVFSLPHDQYHHDHNYIHHNVTTHGLPASDVNEFVDSFINMDHHDGQYDDHDHQNDDDDNKSLQVKTQYLLDHHHDDYLHQQNWSRESDYNRYFPMMMPGGDHEVDLYGSSVSHGVDQGLYLVHLLLACAEAVGCRDTKLANSILAQIWSSATPMGDSLQRVSYCFAMGLKSRLSLLQTVTANGTFTNGGNHVCWVTMEEKMEAFHLLYQTTPFIAFGFMAANEAICQAAQGKYSLHIIDLGMEHTLQWPSLIRNLASRPEGPPKKLKITAIINDQYRIELEGSTKLLVEEANSLGIPLEIYMISEPATPTLMTREKLGLEEGEALLVNSIMHLHKYVKESRGSLKAILQAIKKLSPTLLTVVEQDANHNGPFFLGRFLESLHYYSAIFDSLEASLLRNSPQRMKIEKYHFAEEIRNIVAYEGLDRVERHERADQWRRQLGRAGYQVMGLKCLSQARMMLSVYGCDGYTLSCEKGCLLLGWKGRPIMLASAWQANNSSS